MSDRTIEEDIEFLELERQILADTPSRRELFLFWTGAVLFCVLAWYGIVSGVLALWDYFVG